MEKTKTVMLNVRVTPDLRKNFHNRASQFGEPSDVHREILTAFIDDRLSIIPDPSKPTLYKENANEH